METYTLKEKRKHLFSFPVIVAALGYFVDIYDLLLFGIVRIPSLKDLKLDVDIAGTLILNYQMLGLLLGGVLWGILGDKKGRLSVLFGSILVYSLANIACGFLPYFPFEDKTTTYALLRFVAGVGLAGELGAGITLVSEMMSKEKRGYGTMIIVTFGALGAVVASLVGAKGDAIGVIFESISGIHFANWQVVYIVGGLMGLVLL